MFQSLGNAVARSWPVLLGAWLLLLATVRLTAPPWAEVTQDQEFRFLPASAPSRVSEEVFARAFPEAQLTSTVVLVLERAEDGGTTLEQVRQFIADVLEPGLRQLAEEMGGLASVALPSDEPLFSDEAVEISPARPRSILSRIRTPNTPGSGALLVSADRQALLVVVELTTEFMARQNWPVLEKIEDLLRGLQQQGKVPDGITLSLTGSAVIGRDQIQAQLRGAQATEIWTVVLVIVLLAFIYRAPLLALIPLATVFVAVQVALHLLALLASAGHVALFQGIQIYLTILAYGAGVDYCLFLTARYKEELERGASPRAAVAGALGQVGAALAASAATVVCGIGMMMFAEFGKFRQAGFAIPLGLLVVLAATLTFTPALLCLAGRWAFWPQRTSPGGFQRHWAWLAQVLTRRPGTIWVTTVALMVPFAMAAALLSRHLSYNMIGTLPAEAPGVVGTRALQRHFPAGLTGPVTVLLVNPGVDFDKPAGRALLERLTGQLREQQQELKLADVRSLAAPLGITAAAQQALFGLDVPAGAARHAIAREARDRYLSDLGERGKIGARLDLILESNPFARATIDELSRMEQAIRDALPHDLGSETQVHVVGATASIRDLRAVMDRDRVRIELLVLCSVFVILVLLLRKIVVSLYLIVSVLFSYYATLGVAFAVFWLLDPQGFTGIDWRVAIFLFTILIAVGEDYNIFLMARVDEEQRRLGPVRGITEALIRTGPIISSCGIIMAGTFASLLAGPLNEMKQLGFALAFGVLLDTFVVRPILVPAFLILLQGDRLRWPNWTQNERAPSRSEVHV